MPEKRPEIMWGRKRAFCSGRPNFAITSKFPRVRSGYMFQEVLPPLRSSCTWIAIAWGPAKPPSSWAAAKERIPSSWIRSQASRKPGGVTT